MNYLFKESNFDSVKVLLSEISTGVSSSYRNSANTIKDAIRTYEKLTEKMKTLDTPVVADSNKIDIGISTLPVDTYMDSIVYQLASLFQQKLEFVDSARFYHAILVESFRNSKYRPQSLIYLSEIEPDSDWIGILNSDYPNTIIDPEEILYQSMYAIDVFEEGFSDEMYSKIRDCEKYLDLFPEPMDSSVALPDSSFDKRNTMNIQRDPVLMNEKLEIMQSDYSREKGEIKP